MSLFLLALQTALAGPSLEAGLAQWVSQTCAAVSVEIVDAGVGLAQVQPGLAWRFEGDPCRARPWLTATGVQDDTEVQTLRLNPDLVVWVQRPVAERAYAPGELVVGERAVVRLDAVFGEVAMPGWEATAAIEPGTVLTSSVARPVPAVRDGEAVTLVVEQGAVRLTAPGVCMQDAAVGQTVDVVNEVTRRRVRGVVAPGKQVVLR